MTNLPDNFAETLLPAALETAGFSDPALAQERLRGLAGQGVSDDDLAPLLPLLLNALRQSPDADRALSSFARWFAAVGSPYSHLQTLLRHPVALDVFCLVTGSSQYFADLLVRQPECFEILANPGVRGGTKTAARFYREVSALVAACQRPELKREVLRRWKAREMLRIGVRDLIGLADMPATAREFSNLADACVQSAHDIALEMQGINLTQRRGDVEREAEAHTETQRHGEETGFSPTPYTLHPTPSFCVIAMGKLGGQELNYSSDIDLMFVHGDDLPSQIERADGRKVETVTWLARLAETLVKVLNEDTANGHVFRVDMRLRPEGRFGALTRSLSGYQAYYESWAENWERQALLKARFLAGDRALGEAFMRMVTPYIYRKHVGQAFLDDIRANKRRIEQKCELEGQTETNVKTGFGGIRDIEFTVQLLQLRLGGLYPRLRTPNTLTALHRLQQARFLTDAETRELSEDYQFLRDLEHRLQLLHGFQTQTMPPQGNIWERTQLARRMGFRELTTFETELRRRRERVHAHCERLFYRADAPDTPNDSQTPPEWGDLNDLLDAIDAPAAQEALAALLTAHGFHDLPNALRALRLPMCGNEFGEMPPDTPTEFKTIAPRLLDLLAHGPDPDAGLAGMEALATAVPNRAHLYAALDDSPELLQKVVRLAAGSPPLFNTLVRHQEWMETVFGEGEDLPSDSEDTGLTAWYTQELVNRVRGGGGLEAHAEALARLLQRERLRIGARDVWEENDVAQTQAQLTALAAAALQTLLTLCAEGIAAAHPEPTFARDALARMAIVGLGKLGGAELGYASDWDIVFVYDEAHLSGERARTQERFDLATQAVQRLNNLTQTLATHGAKVEIDLRLRPWGKQGALIHSLHGFAAYYRTAGETWERQAAMKARFVAGSRPVGERCVRLLQAISYGRGLTKEEDKAVRAMKRRIESERLKPGERDTDLKLGSGGLTDIEWLAQRLQLLNGPRDRALRQPNTFLALSALANARLLDNAEADVLTSAYALLTRLRNACWLLSGTAQDTLPSEPRRLRALARLLGYGDSAFAPAEQQMQEDVHAAMQETRRIFQDRFF